MMNEVCKKRKKKEIRLGKKERKCWMWRKGLKRRTEYECVKKQRNKMKWRRNELKWRKKKLNNSKMERMKKEIEQERKNCKNICENKKNINGRIKRGKRRKDVTLNWFYNALPWPEEFFECAIDVF